MDLHRRANSFVISLGIRLDLANPFIDLSARGRSDVRGPRCDLSAPVLGHRDDLHRDSQTIPMIHI